MNDQQVPHHPEADNQVYVTALTLLFSVPKNKPYIQFLL